MTLRNPQTMIVAALAAVALLVAGAGMLLVVVPQHSKLGKTASELSVAEAKLLVAQAPVQTPQQIDAVALYRLREAMPASDSMPDVLLQLSEIAKASSVALVSVKPSPRIVMPQGHQALPLSVVIHGRYAAIVEFLHVLRVFDGRSHGQVVVKGRLFVTNGVQMNATQAPAIDATLTMDAFDYGVPTPTTATAGAATSDPTATTTTTSTTTG